MQESRRFVFVAPLLSACDRPSTSPASPHPPLALVFALLLRSCLATARMTAGISAPSRPGAAPSERRAASPTWRSRSTYACETGMGMGNSGNSGLELVKQTATGCT